MARILLRLLLVLLFSENLVVVHNRPGWIDGGGASWTPIDRGGLTVQSVANGGRSTSFVLDSAGKVWHLNTILSQTTITVTGHCTALSCTSNPNFQVAFTQYAWDLNASGSYFGNGTSGYTCGTWTNGGNDGPFCQVISGALPATDVNLFVSGASTTCDAFAPGQQQQCTVRLDADIALLGISLLHSSQNCNCATRPVFFNQKYKVTSTRNVAPVSAGWWGISWLFGGDTWIWENVSLLQWCDPVVKPSLSFYNGKTWISHVFKGAKPTAMPGQYINGDVPGIASIDGVMVYPDLGPTGTIATLLNFASGKGPTTGTTNGGIYTWNSTDTDYRGPAGQPYQTCQGQ